MVRRFIISNFLLSMITLFYGCQQVQIKPNVEKYIEVTIEELLTSPSKYVDNKVYVEGYLRSGFEELALYPTDSIEKQNGQYFGIWIWDTKNDYIEKNEKIHSRNCFVELIGKFYINTNRKSGHLGCWPAEIQNIEYFHTIEYEVKYTKRKAISVARQYIKNNGLDEVCLIDQFTCSHSGNRKSWLVAFKYKKEQKPSAIILDVNKSTGKVIQLILR